MEFRSIQTTIKTMSKIILVGTIALLQVPTVDGENLISLTKTESRDVLQIECYSNSEITFQFFDFKMNTTTYLARCEVLVKTCYLVSADAISTYDITFDGSQAGGILRIKHREENVCGTYRCCQTYNPGSCSNSTTITLNEDTTTVPTTVTVVEQVSILMEKTTHLLNNHCNEPFSIALVISITTAVVSLVWISAIVLYNRRRNRNLKRADIMHGNLANHRFLMKEQNSPT